MAKTVFETVKGERTYPILPSYVSDEAINIADNARKVLEKRYLRRDLDGSLMETPAGMFYRVAYHVAQVEKDHECDTDAMAKTFYDLLTERRFFPNSPTFTGAGTPLGQLAACFVLPIADDMGKEDGGIFNTLRDAALIQQTGGGNGFSFSRLRPKNDVVHASSGRATGPVGFLKVYDQAFGEIAQGGSRRGANMAVLRCDHPDIEEFITCKAEEGKIANFNISVAITDEFMQAVKDDADFSLRNPRDGKVWRTVKARTLFDKIVKYAHRNGEPGVLFIDAANRSNPVPHLYDLEATNPCGEQWLGPYENCCLGSINLAEHVTTGTDGLPQVDWALLQRTVRESTHFLDNVVSANAYVPAVPQLREAALRARRIGLGIMGLGDMLYKLGVRYGDTLAQTTVRAVMELVRYECMMYSVELAKTRGRFPAFSGSIYESDKWIPAHDPYGDIPWRQLADEIKTHGIRNAAQTTIAPTGTIATVVGCEGYGCEPVFALGYVRHFKDGDKDVELTYTSPLFQAELDRLVALGYLSEQRSKEIAHHVALHGSCQDVADLPIHTRNTFVVSSDITADEHVRMQAALQEFVDNSLSKTCNFPEGATEDDVAKAYMLAWELGCKGLTVYVTGSRDQVVLETKAPKDKKAQPATPTHHEPQKRPRPDVLSGRAYKKKTPAGTAYITVNSDEREQPFEVFLNIGKAGSEVAAVSEAIGRLTSLILRIPSAIAPSERVAEIVDELSAIGGSRPLGFGNGRVLSLPDGIAQVLRGHMQGAVVAEQVPQPVKHYVLGDICPECGEASFLNVEGCRKCAACGYSEC